MKHARTSLQTSIKLKKLGFTLPSYYYYEWTGAKEEERLNDYVYLIDSINTYSARQLKRALPKNVVPNENVVEMKIKPGDNEAEQWGKLAIFLMEQGVVLFDRFGRLAS